MRGTTARTVLRQAVARPELGRIYDVSQPRFTAAATYRALCAWSQHFSPHLSTASLSTPRGHGARTIHTTTPAPASKGKGVSVKAKKGEEHKKRMEEASTSSSSNGEDEGPKHPTPDAAAPLEFADVHSRIRQQDARFQEALLRLRSGGRFNPDTVGSLRVQPDRKSGATYPLREVAQVIPRGGRTLSVLVHEEAYVKPIMSAIQASPDFNQQPQRDPDNELELVLKIEPEKRDDVLRRVKATCHEWRDRVRAVRQKRDKLHTTWRKEAGIGPDMKRTADKELNKIIANKMSAIDDAEKGALKAAEGK